VAAILHSLQAWQIPQKMEGKATASWSKKYEEEWRETKWK